MKLAGVGLALSVSVGVCAAAEVAKPIPFEVCFNSAAKHFSVNKTLLVAIAKTESEFNPIAINRSNADGSTDVGLMQINSWWFPTLQKFGIKSDQLFEPCSNIYVGLLVMDSVIRAAWILSQNIQQHGNKWKAVGAYNARSPIKQITYVNKVMASAAEIKQNYIVR